MSRVHLAALWAIGFCLVLSRTASTALAADADSGGVVSGTGTVKVKRLPQMVRVQTVVSGEGKDIAAAVAKLKEAQAAASRKLAEAGAAEKSIEFGAIQMGAGPADAKAQYAQYIQEMQRMAMQQGAAAKKAAKPEIVIVSATLKAEFPLKAKSEEELFVEGQSLQEKFKATGIHKTEAKKLTPEEEEALEEAGGAGAGGSGEPTFQYVCKIPDAERAAARTEAFQKAKQDAADLARAAGSELAGLRQMTATVTSPTAAEGRGAEFAQTLMQQMTGNYTSVVMPEAVTDEASAFGPMPVTLQISVTASFAVK